jgi:tetratricopeptide (TPR) repeat protein
VTLLQHAVKLAPENTLARAMLGNAWVERGNLDEALAEFTAIIRSRRDDANGWLRVGMVLTEQRKPAQAIPYYQNAIQLAPGWPEPRRRLALALLSMGRKDDARTVYMTLPELMPNTADGHRDLADMFAEGQQPAEAVQHYNEALRLKPEFPVVLNNLAFLRATCAQPEWRDGRQAVQLAERVCQESGNKNPEFLSTLAAAYAEAERFGEAVKWIQKAQAVAKASGATNSLPRYSQMLEQFQTGKPFRVNAPQ